MFRIPALPYDYEVPNLSQLALVIIDMQRDFLEPGGFGEILGNDVALECHQPDLSDCPISKRKRGKGSLTIGDEGPMGRILIRGEAGNAIIPDLAPIEGEIVIHKPGKGAFYATELQDSLQKRGITHLFFTGVTTEVCVQTTMREANDRGYECLMVEDCTASYFPHFKQSTLDMVRAQGGIVGWTTSAQEIQKALSPNN
ncbi:MAG: isochorismatase family cysteine hydrolase [Cyanobacteriota bacterium]